MLAYKIKYPGKVHIPKAQTRTQTKFDVGYKILARSAYNFKQAHPKFHFCSGLDHVHLGLA